MNSKTTDKTTGRQVFTGKDGMRVERKYMYLPTPVWLALQKLAVANNTSISNLIENFALNGKGITHDSNTKS